MLYCIINKYFGINLESFYYFLAATVFENKFFLFMQVDIFRNRKMGNIIKNATGSVI